MKIDRVIGVVWLVSLWLAIHTKSQCFDRNQNPLEMLDRTERSWEIDEALHILEIDSWQTVYEFPGEFSRPFFSLDGQLLAVSPSRIGPARLIDIVMGEERWQING